MAEVEVIEEKPITMVELKEKLEKLKNESEKLNFRSQKTLDYLERFVKLKLKNVSEIRNKLSGLDILRMKEKHIAKIVDLNPKDIDALRTILANENIATKTEDLNKILECLK